MILGKKPESWREALKFISRCPVCNENYNLEGAKLVEEKDNACLIHLTCGKCQGYFLTMVLNFSHGLSSVGMITDLNYNDAQRIYRSVPLTLDEVLNTHQLIEKNNFNF